MSGLRCFIYIFVVVLFMALKFLFFFWTIADLLHCTNEPNVSIPQLANLLIERSQNSNWVVVFKSLVTTHHLMCYGNEVYYIWFSPSFVMIYTQHLSIFIWQRFTQYLASSNCSFQLNNFLDKGNVAGNNIFICLCFFFHCENVHQSTKNMEY